MAGGKPPGYPVLGSAQGVAQVSPQISFAQMAMGHQKTPEQQFADHPGMMPPAMALPSAALDPKAAARAAAAAAAGAKQKQLEVAAAVGNSATASARAQAAEMAKQQQKRLEVAAEAESAELTRHRAEQAAMEADLNRRQQLLESAKQDAMHRAMQLERAAREQQADSMLQSVNGPSMQHNVQQQKHQTGQHPSAMVPSKQPVARPIDVQAWPAIKPSPGASLPAQPQSVWGAKPSSILQAPAPKEEKKPTEQQKVVKAEHVPQQKNAWGNIAVGQSAAPKPGTPKRAVETVKAKEKEAGGGSLNTNAQPPLPTGLEGGQVQASCENADGDGSVDGARKMLAGFLADRGPRQGMELNVNQWASAGSGGGTGDENTDEVFFMRPHGITSDSGGSNGGNMSWEAGSNAHQPQMQPQSTSVEPSAWAVRAPRISDTGPEDAIDFGSGLGGGSFGKGFGEGRGFGRLDGPEGLNFDFGLSDGNMFADMGASGPGGSAWGNAGTSVNTGEQGAHVEEEDGADKSPSVALKMMLGIGIGGASGAVPQQQAAPPVARKLPVWGKPDGKMDISMDPAIAQIAQDMPGVNDHRHAQQEGTGGMRHMPSDAELVEEERRRRQTEMQQQRHAEMQLRAQQQQQQLLLQQLQQSSPSAPPSTQQQQNGVALPPSPPRHLMQQHQQQHLHPADERMACMVPFQHDHQPNLLQPMPDLQVCRFDLYVSKSFIYTVITFLLLPSIMPSNCMPLTRKGPSAFMQMRQSSDAPPPQEQMGAQGLGRSMPTPEQWQQMLQGMGPGPPHSQPQQHQLDQQMPPNDSRVFREEMERIGIPLGMFPGPQGGGEGGPGGVIPGQAMQQNSFGPGGGGNGDHNLPPWMLQGNMGGPPVGGIPPWMQGGAAGGGLTPWMQGQGPMGMGGPPGSMGPMGVMGQGRDNDPDLLKMLSGMHHGPGGPGQVGGVNSFQQGHLNDRPVGGMTGQSGEQGGFDFNAFSNQAPAGIDQPRLPSGGGIHSEGGFDFNKVFGGGMGGDVGMHQMGPMSPPRPGAMMSLAELEGRMN